MEVITFSQAAKVFGVSSASISRWVKEGKLQEGSKAGKQKTVTQESTDALANNSAFQIGRESTKRKIAQLNTKKEEMKELKQRIESLERLVENISEEIKTFHKIAQKCEKEIAVLREGAQKCEKEIAVLREVAQKCDKKRRVSTKSSSNKKD